MYFLVISNLSLNASCFMHCNAELLSSFAIQFDEESLFPCIVTCYCNGLKLFLSSHLCLETFDLRSWQGNMIHHLAFILLIIKYLCNGASICQTTATTAAVSVLTIKITNTNWNEPRYGLIKLTG